ncbi:hypothetical protein KWI10_24815, partial [Enterobacter asburiae]|nr:hypothetical protein [Enterobacter asburiae]
SNHASPDQKTIDIARSPKSRQAPENSENVESQSPGQNKDDLPAVCPARSAQLDKELKEAFSHTVEQEQKKQIDELTGRELA